MRTRRDGAWRTWLLAGLMAAIAPARDAALSAPPAKAPPAAPVSGGSFPRRHEEYVALVENGSERALGFLIAAYRRPELDLTERGRIASLALDAFPSPECTAAIRTWREKDATWDDAWLWFKVLRREIASAGPEAALAAAADPARPAAIRAAAIRALAAWAEPDLVNFVAETAKQDLGKDPDRSILVQALAEALVSQAGRVGTPALREAFGALLPFLGKGGAEARTRLLVARSFSRMLAAPDVPLDAAVFEALLDRRERPPSPEDDRYAAPRFVGLEATGDRVVYVVDESGSMDDLLTDEERKDLQQAMEGSKSAGDPKAAIPWEKVRTRRHAAIELTKASLRALPEQAFVSVVLFGTGVAWIGTPFTLVPATKQNVDSITKALDGPRVGGGTNLHGGLRRALDAVAGGRKGKVTLGSTIDPATAVLGPTTVFLLTDGEPSVDDWGFDYKGVGISPWSSDWHPTAPFQEPFSLVEDIERLNLLRGCEIHAVGIGEADVRLLDLLARAGRGKVRRIGTPRADRTKPPPAPAGPSTGRTWRDLVDQFKRLGVPVPKSVQDEANKEEKAERAEKKKAEEKEKKEGKEKGAKPADGVGGSDPAAGGGAERPAPPAPPGAPPPQGASADPDVEALRHGATAAAREQAAWRIGERKYALAVPDLIHALVEDPDGDVRLACHGALRGIAGRTLAEFRRDLFPWEKESLRRNWTWWWDLHRAAVEKAAAPPGGPAK